MTEKRLRVGSRCPSCAKGKLIPIVYGFPLPELLEQDEQGEVALGGCVITEIVGGPVTWGAPPLQCQECKREYYRDGRAHDQMPTYR